MIQRHLPRSGTSSRPVSRILVCRSVLLIALSFGFPLFSSSNISAQVDPSGDAEVLRVTTDLLLFPVRIRNRQGQPVGGVTERDLSLKDADGVTSGVYFAAGVDRVALVFALDQSGSLREVISQQREAALGLYRRFSDKSSIAVMHFAETSALAAPFARDTAVASMAFSLSAHANQRTAIFDAAARSIEMFDVLPRVRTERRIVVIISDGLDNASRRKASDIIDIARHQRVSFYVIHLPLFEPRDGRLAVRRPTKGFRDLAEKTGGKYFIAAGSALEVRSKIDLAPIFQAIEEDLKSQYLLGFYLNEKANDGRRHTLSLSLPQGFEYQVGPRGYERTQKFLVDRPREVLKNPR
jgi:Ca-activated chloride channel family protein